MSCKAGLLGSFLSGLHSETPVSVSSAGTTTASAAEFCKYGSFTINAGAGAGTYTRTIDLDETYRVAGDIFDFLIVFDGANPTINIDWDGGTILSIPSNSSEANAMFKWNGTDFVLVRAAI